MSIKPIERKASIRVVRNLIFLVFKRLRTSQLLPLSIVHFSLNLDSLPVFIYILLFLCTRFWFFPALFLDSHFILWLCLVSIHGIIIHCLILAFILMASFRHSAMSIVKTGVVRARNFLSTHSWVFLWTGLLILSITNFFKLPLLRKNITLNLFGLLSSWNFLWRFSERNIILLIELLFLIECHWFVHISH